MSILHCPISSTQLFKGGLPHVTLQGTPKLPVGQRKPWPSGRALGSRMGRLSGTTAGYLQKELQTGRKLLSNTPSSPPRPSPGPGSALPMGTSGNTRATSQVVARGGNGIVLKSCLPLPQSGWCMSFHTDASWGEEQGEGGIPPPCRKELGQGEGGVAEAEFRGKAVSGESSGTDTE